VPGEPFLTTRRLVLRRFTADDADLLVDLDADPVVMRYINGGSPTSRREIVDEVLPAFLSYYDRFPGCGFWAAVESASGRFLGWFHLRPGPDDDPDEPELGYRLRRDAWGEGYATEGARALIDRAFRDFGARRVHASTMAINTGSRRVMEKAGLHFVRHFVADWPVPIDGDEHGDVEYALTRAQWLAENGNER
jgi:RimJ/RimL family protein N-acetyltransferase